jgi:hypothetical protein
LQEKTVMRQVAIPREVYTGSCNQLFDFLAEALVHFIKEQSKVWGRASGAATGLHTAGPAFEQCT